MKLVEGIRQNTVDTAQRMVITQVNRLYQLARLRVREHLCRSVTAALGVLHLCDLRKDQVKIKGPAVGCSYPVDARG